MNEPVSEQALASLVDNTLTVAPFPSIPTIRPILPHQTEEEEAGAGEEGPEARFQLAPEMEGQHHQRTHRRYHVNRRRPRTRRNSRGESP